MDVTFLVAVSMFLLFISLILVSAINYFTRAPESATIIELRSKTKNLFDTFFGSGGIVTSERVTTDLYRIPILLEEANGTSRTNEAVSLSIDFNSECDNPVSWNNTVRVYNQNFNELPSKISYQNFCSSQYLNSSLVTFLVNMSAYEKKRVYVYSINNSNTIASKHNMTLKGYWKLDDGSGTTATDSSGFGNNGTISGTTWTSGKYGNALNFDGVDDVVTGNLPSNAINDRGTVSAWVNFSVVVGSDAPIAGAKGSGWFGVAGYYNNIAGEIYGSSNGASCGGATVTCSALSGQSCSLAGYVGKWVHVAMTFDNSTHEASFYINGVKVGNQTWYMCSLGSSQTFQIGGRISVYTNGSIDDVRIYNETLSASRIATLALGANQPLSTKTFPIETVTAIVASKAQGLMGRNYEEVKAVLGGDYDFRIEISEKT